MSNNDNRTDTQKAISDGIQKAFINKQADDQRRTSAVIKGIKDNLKPTKSDDKK